VHDAPTGALRDQAFRDALRREEGGVQVAPHDLLERLCRCLDERRPLVVQTARDVDEAKEP
jgi:hypothetical protein